MTKTQRIAEKPLDYYLKLSYPITITCEEDGGYVAEIKSLPGCITQGETAEETLSNIDEARHLWLEVAHEKGDRIPLPPDSQEHSGKLVVRMDPTLHKTLAEAASKEGKSLNKHIVNMLESAHRLWELQHRHRSVEDVYEEIKQTLASSVEKSIEEALEQLQQIANAEMVTKSKSKG